LRGCRAAVGFVEAGADRFCVGPSASGLNDGGFTLADRGLAFADATRKAKGENHRADDNQQFSHRVPPL